MKYNIHTHHPQYSMDTLELVNQDLSRVDFSIPHFSLGIHPWYIVEAKIEEQLNWLEANLNHPNCLALGECGLDKKIDIPWNVNVEEEIAKLEEELKYLKGFLKSVQGKLSNEKFVSGAPEQVVANEKQKEADALAKISTIEHSLAGLK